MTELNAPFKTRKLRPSSFPRNRGHRSQAQEAVQPVQAIRVTERRSIVRHIADLTNQGCTLASAGRCELVRFKPRPDMLGVRSASELPDFRTVTGLAPL